jgi:hypothetical protein
MQSFTSTVHQGTNHPSPYHGYGFIHAPKGISSRVRFNDSARYNLNSRDQFDWNKTFGLNGSEIGIECRWGWRWNLDANCLELYPYVRHNGSVIFDNSLIFSGVSLNEWLNLKIEVKSDRYVFTLNGQVKEVFLNLAGKYNGSCQYNALWFGGTSPAPQQVTVEYENFDAFVEYHLSNATQTWTVEYLNADGHPATADGSAGESFSIIAKIESPRVVLGDVQIAPI